MSGEKILIVDDDRTTAKIIAVQLRDMGYKVVGHVRSGTEAVRDVKSQSPDLVLMDINLGKGADGIESASTILREFETPVVYVTAYSDDATLERARHTHPFGYINKPVRPEDLRTTVALALDRANAQREKEQDSPVTDERIWKATFTCNAQGQVTHVPDQEQTALRLSGFREAGEALPPDAAAHVSACLRGKRPQMVSGRLAGRIFSWEFRPVPRDKSVRVTVTDITSHSRLIDQNLLQASLSEALDHLTTGVLFINEHLKVYYTNRAADRILIEGSELSIKENQLRCPTAERTAELQRLILNETGGTFTLERGAEASPLHLLVSPMHSHNENYGQDRPISIVYVFETVKDTDRIRDVIRSLYSLSPTEARIAAKLVLQPDLVAVARAMGITYNTARTHLKRIYAKTGVNRLPALVHMVVTGPVGLLIHSSE